MNELIEKMRDRFWRIEEENNADASSTFVARFAAFLQELRVLGGLITAIQCSHPRMT